MWHPGAHTSPPARAARQTATPFLRLRYDHRIYLPGPRVDLRALRGGPPGARPRLGGRTHRRRPRRARRATGHLPTPRPAVPPGHPRPAGQRRAPGPRRLRAVLGRGRRGERGRARGARRASQAASRQHAEDPVRAGRAAGAAGRDPAPGRAGRTRGRGGREQPCRGAGRADLPGRGPVAWGLPQLRERRRARSRPAQRRLAERRRTDAGQGTLARCARHARPVSRRVRHARSGLLRLRSRRLRAGRAAQPGLRAVLRYGRGEVPRGRRLVVRDPEHQSAAHRRRRGGAVRRAGRDQERLHQPCRQHARRRRRARWPHARRHRDEPSGRWWFRRVRGGA